ncbi:hypothetical protein bcere0002_27750 [Bacillus cereus ATCC 10876]|nr:hypothetical protein bcere0002_27750 [Bacillus cereus ATCC 10876]KZD44454.1 hypothetical protein B4084_4265 [Bacillus cereus]
MGIVYNWSAFFIVEFCKIQSFVYDNGKIEGISLYLSGEEKGKYKDSR